MGCKKISLLLLLLLYCLIFLHVISRSTETRLVSVDVVAGNSRELKAVVIKAGGGGGRGGGGRGRYRGGGRGVVPIIGGGSTPHHRSSGGRESASLWFGLLSTLIIFGLVFVFN
ncbi:unnamed protein product [Cochlearia groenlandica]